VDPKVKPMASPLLALTTGPRPQAVSSVRPTAGNGLVAALGLGLAVTLLQLALVCLVTAHASPLEAYRSLYQWDSKWYARLAEQGYPDDLPRERKDMAKLGFFPGYPLWVRIVARLAGLTAADGTLLAAQLACWGFWTYVLLLARRWGVTAPLAALGAMAILVHPCAFFLVAGYSESLFLTAVLGFLYWSGVRGPVGWSLAALHGVVMTGTRIVGLPLAVCPVVLAAVALLTEKGTTRRLVPAAVLSAVALLGGLLFFGFCQLQYGRWDAYMWTQRTGWGVTPDYLALFKPETYRVAVPTFVGGIVNPNELSRLCVPCTVILFGAFVLAECRAAKADAGRGWRERLGLYLAGGLMFDIAVSGLANSYLISMIRYTFCVHVMLTLAAVHLLARAPLPRGRWRAVLAGFLASAVILSVTFETMFVLLFTHGEWVA
jgi:hypothetical protein